MELIGLPPDFVLDQSTRRKIFFDDETDEPLLVTTDSRGKLRIPGSKTLRSSLLPGCQSESFLDFIERCLDWDPLTRITPYEALLHEWIIEGLPPKVLLHHKRMLGVYEEAKNPPAMISGMPNRYGAEMIK
jgi:dual specificity tyrosine-phosphorylation-regulated kinase 2/3/4